MLTLKNRVSDNKKPWYKDKTLQGILATLIGGVLLWAGESPADASVIAGSLLSAAGTIWAFGAKIIERLKERR